MTIEDILSACPTAKIWEKVGVKEHHGINIPLSAIRTHRSSGIGEFYDLILLIDWVHAIRMDVIQMLPLNDTGMDPSPYNALSSLALNPIYIGLDSLPYIDRFSEKSDMSDFRHLNETKKLKFREIKQMKERFLRSYFNAFSSEIKANEEYSQFVSENSWIQPYALFLTLKKKFHYVSWKKWPKEYQYVKTDTLFSLLQEFSKEIEFHSFLQFTAHIQMKEVKQYATKKGVLLKGDIPILLSPDSADVWFDRENFIMDYGAGCPPDMFNERGQNWGFPLFHWEYIERNHYAWWKRRLSVAANYYHLYRIDHLVGFFRIWSVPIGEKAIDGHFTSRNRYQWPFDGIKRLNSLIESSSMLPMGEDLGTIPAEVPSILKRLGITGTKLIRWERYWDEDASFIPLDGYEPISLSTLSSHDTQTVGEWWENYPLESQEYARSRKIHFKPDFTPDLRLQILEDAHQTSSLFHINLLPEYLALFPELSWDSFAEDRINVPGTNLDTNWTFRLKVPLEEMIHHKDLIDTMISLTSKKEILNPVSQNG